MRKSKRIVKQKTSSNLKTSEPEPIKLSHSDLLKALYFVMDLFSRPNIPFFLLDETAKQAKEGKQLEGDHITVGIRYLDYKGGNLSILDAFYKAEEIDRYHIKYVYCGVPIFVKIIDSADSMFTSTASFPYEMEYFNVPNPFYKYWENRHSYESQNAK